MGKRVFSEGGTFLKAQPFGGRGGGRSSLNKNVLYGGEHSGVYRCLLQGLHIVKNCEAQVALKIHRRPCLYKEPHCGSVPVVAGQKNRRESSYIPPLLKAFMDEEFCYFKESTTSSNVEARVPQGTNRVLRAQGEESLHQGEVVFQDCLAEELGEIHDQEGDEFRLRKIDTEPVRATWDRNRASSTLT